MRKTVFFAVLLVATLIGSIVPDAMSQTVSKKTADQYRQMVAMCNGAKRPTFEACKAQLEKYGFTYNKAGIVDMFTMQMHPFVRAEGQDTVACTLVVLNDTVFTIGGTFSSLDAARAFAVESKASDLQAQLAAKMGCTKYVGSVKGNVKKATYDRKELLAALEGVDAEMVSMVFEQWKSEDGRREMTCIYKNNRYGKKKPKDRDRIEITLSVGNTTR